MYQASEEWLQQNQKYKDYQINIAAIELTGKNFKVTNFIKSISYDL
jgi:ornithine carbamoyltransferase